MNISHDENRDAFYLDRTGRGHLRLTGRDRQSFLQGMVSNDVARLAPGGGCYAFLLDATGHVLSDARVFCTDDAVLLDMEPGRGAFVAETLEKYLIMERCKITDVTDETAQVLVGGLDAAALLWSLLGLSGIAEWGEGQNAIGMWNGAPVLVAAVRLVPTSAFAIYAPPGHLATLFDALASAGASPITPAELETLRVEAGVPRFGADMDARALAPETNQDARAISYRKGCYIGQEIVARIHARGHTNRGLVGIAFDASHAPAIPAPDTPICELETGKEIGRITSAAHSPRLNRVVALGYVRHEHAQPGALVTVAGAAARVAALPFAAPDTAPANEQAVLAGSAAS